MTILDAILLGLVQGLTEFIPISSSGHLILAQKFLGQTPNHLFLEWINIGTILALLIYFRRRLWAIARDIIVDRHWQLALKILVAAIPAGLVGFFGADFIENSSFFSNVWVVVVMLALLGVVMVILPRLPHASALAGLEQLPYRRAIGIGIAQVLALIPGTSRSGSTIIAGRLLGLKAADAAEFSFLVSLPIMFGVTAKIALKSADRDYLWANLTPLVAGNIAALVSGLLAVGFLMRYLARHDLSLFGWYRIGLAALLALVLMI